ncbi:MAG: aldo/keto reductase [Thermoplasmata archaeon]|nr:aldo/keto reductase [Thermoplasmata archaeon]
MAREPSAARAGSVRLGDRKVHRLGLGGNRLTNTESVHTLLGRAVELGVNFIDTSDVYQFNASESAIGEALRNSPHEVVVATKGGIVRTPDGGDVDGSAEYLREAVAGSLERLGVDRIELYQLHRVDPKVPIETSVGALRDLQKEGQIRRIGLCNVSIEELERARRVTTIVSVQNQFNLFEREQEPMLDYCDQHSIAFIPWNPVHRGSLAASTTLSEMATRYHATPPQLALRWLLQRSPVVLPIPGTLSVPHLEENLAAADIELSDEDFRRLSEPPAPPAAKR